MKKKKMSITGEFLHHASAMAKSIDARAIILYADVFSGLKELEDFLRDSGQVPVILATRGGTGQEPDLEGGEVIRVPGIRLTRLGQIKIAVLVGFSKGYFKKGDRLVCLSGIAGSGMLDTLVIMDVGDEFEMFAATGAADVASNITPEVFERVLDIATTLGYEGREGKPVGTTFVIGDVEKVMQLSRQMVLNPFRGYTEEERNILDPSLEETVKEFAVIDGAFVIQADGHIEAAGVYLKPETGGESLPRGLGTRHRSAAGITATTEAVAITVSESTGTVTVFRGGNILIELERPRPIGSSHLQEANAFPGLRRPEEQEKPD
ncbi:DNA integrity scanning protein DisA nucleotide-binding domain protein [Geoalkalibacter subterraneus]|uniref:DNA integrity scanning protein DisA nucleotide-binding domain protein n=1 Tax=Geoalkalibacter subterraneus TaxID=483547 RepID=UPI0006946BC3|nr:diadenylate cyclase [Geoalkalibacter subterraneus]